MPSCTRVRRLGIRFAEMSWFWLKPFSPSCEAWRRALWFFFWDISQRFGVDLRAGMFKASSVRRIGGPDTSGDIKERQAACDRDAWGRGLLEIGRFLLRPLARR